MGPLKGQLTLRGVLVGCVGCVIITASSLYVALKMGALPWPILFAAIVSLFFLKLLDKASKNPAGNPGGNPVGNPTGEPVGELTGKSEGNPVGNPVGNLGGKTSTTSLHEVNVTHTIMSAGAMVAGGLAFTIPGVWILGNTEGVDWWQMLAVALSGVVLGLVCTVCLRRHFIENAGLEYPMGEATAQTLLAGNAGGKVGRKLFGAFGFAGIYAALRDWLGVIPSMLLGGVQVPGIAFGIYNSPMLLAIGFLVGTAAIVAWLIGALIGNLGLVAGASLFGLWSAEEGRQIASSLGMGLMMGCGVAVVIKVIASAIRGVARGTGGGADSGALCGTARGMDRDATNGAAREKARASVNCEPREGTHKPWRESLLSGGHSGIKRMGAGFMAVALAGVALVLCFVLGLGPVPSIIVVAFVWVTVAMAAQSVGQTGIDPMEIFGLIVLLIVAAFSQVSQVQLFFVSGVIAIACGLTGDLMNDFKAGHRLGTNPRAQGVGQLIGGVLGAFVAVAVLCVLVQAYGTDAFGLGAPFVATQASIVATMISGIPSIPAFLVGLAAGCILYFAGLPSMMIGLGVYLPFYMSLTASLGLVAKLFFGLFTRRRLKRLPESEQVVYKAAQDETGLILASGLLGGESVAGVMVALASVLFFLGG